MSAVQICNRALSTYLGEGRINSLDEDTPAAEQCQLHYDDTLRGLLESHWWVFATGRKVLAAVENDRPNEWSFKYSRPSEALSIRWVNEPSIAAHLLASDKDPDSDRKSEGDFIYSNVSAASCEYTTRVTDTTKFPQYFKDALSAALAANMAMAITKDIKRTQNAMQMAGEMHDKAMVLDERETPPELFQAVPDFLAARGIS